MLAYAEDIKGERVEDINEKTESMFHKSAWR
jgi:hypothetical protein